MIAFFQPVFVLNGYNYLVKTPEKERRKEMDFVIVHPRTRTIAILQCKSTLSPRSFKDAAEQLDEDERFLKAILPRLSGWFLVRGVPFARKKRNNTACSGRRSFPFDIQASVARWSRPKPILVIFFTETSQLSAF